MERLYKEIGLDDVEKYLSTGRVRVESEDGVYGEITFMESSCLAQFQLHTIPRSSVMLEFEIPSIDKLYPSGEPFCRKLKLIRDKKAQDNQKWWGLLGSEFKLVGIVILSDLKADWEKIRSLLDANGQFNVIIKGAYNLKRELETIG